MFVNTKLVSKKVLLNTNLKIQHHNLAISCFILFLCNVKQLKQNGYEQNFEGNSCSNADDGFYGGMQQAR